MSVQEQLEKTMTSSFYANPSYMNGGSFTIYSGSRRQRGGGFLGSLRSVMKPVGQNIIKGVKAIARNKAVQDIAKAAAQTGTQLLANVAVDALHGQDIRDSFSNRGKQAALNILTGDNDSPPSKKRKMIVNNNSSYVNTQEAPSRKLKQKKGKTIVRKNYRRQKRLSRAELNRKDLF